MATAIFRHLTDDGLVGDGTNQAANVNGASTAVKLWSGPADGKIWHIERMIILVEDNAVFNAQNYGGVATLANGVTVQRKSGGATGTVEQDLLDGTTVKSGVGWAAHCYDYTYHQHGSGDNFFVVRWTFGKSGKPLKLDGGNTDVLVATINDDLSTLVAHHFIIQGVEYDEYEVR
jgi:hypothetical protein